MELFVLRHGDAEPRITTDEVRPLSARGKVEVESVVKSAQQTMHGLEIILVSPLLRAQQTAEIAHQFLPAVPMETTELLIPESRPSALYELLQGRAEKSVLLVSHQPLVGNFINELCGTPNYHAMGTANLACIDCDVVAVACGELRWLKRPDEI